MEFTQEQKALAIRKVSHMAKARKEAMDKGGNSLGDRGNRTAYFRTVVALREMRSETASNRRWSYWLTAFVAGIE